MSVPEAPGGGTAGIGTRTLSGMLWAYGSYVGGRLLVLASTAVLARMLTPEAFGLVALALLVTTLLEMVGDLGVGQALVASPEEDVEERANSAFLVSVGLGATLTVLVALLSPLGAAAFDEPQLTPIIAVLGLNFVLRSLGSTHNALAQKRLDFRTRTIAEMADVVVRGAASVLLAVAGAGVWSIVLGYLIGTVTLVATLWVLVDWRPRLRWDGSRLRGLLRFGGALSAVDVLAAVISNVDYVFVGKVLGAKALGLYTLAFRLPELLVVNLSVVAGKVLFPAFAAVARADLARVFLISLRCTVILAMPVAAGLAVLSEPLLLAAFGPQWGSAASAMQLLAVFAFWVTLGVPAGTVYKATGRAGVLVKLAIPRAVAATAAVAVFADQGIAAVAACQAAVACAFEIVGIALASRLLAVGPRAIWSALWPAVLVTAAVVAATLPIERAIDGALVTLLAAGAAGAAAYAGAVWLVARDLVRELRSRLRPGPVEVADLPATRGTDAVA